MESAKGSAMNSLKVSVKALAMDGLGERLGAVVVQLRGDGLGEGLGGGLGDGGLELTGECGEKVGAIGRRNEAKHREIVVDGQEFLSSRRRTTRRRWACDNPWRCVYVTLAMSLVQSP